MSSLSSSSSTPSLLLLPPAPDPITSASISAAYRPSLVGTVSVLKGLSSSTVLQVAVPFPAIHGQLQVPRSELFDKAQKLFGRLYSLICVVCAKLGANVDADSSGSIDARVILVHFNSSHSLIDQDCTYKSCNFGPIIDLQTLATARRRWSLMFSVKDEEGQKFLAEYTRLANQHRSPLAGHVIAVSGGLSLIDEAKPTYPKPNHMAVSHRVVAVGGTFDHLHAGHKLLLTATAFLLQPAPDQSIPDRRLIVGITGDELLKNKKYPDHLKSWKQRHDDVVDFLLSVLFVTSSASFDVPVPNGRIIHTKLDSCRLTIECVKIQDHFGPTVTDESITALVVSRETRSGGQAVNQKRNEKGWKALEVFEVDVLDAEDLVQDTKNTGDFVSKISSTEIRRRKAESG